MPHYRAYVVGTDGNFQTPATLLSDFDIASFDMLRGLRRDRNNQGYGRWTSVSLEHPGIFQFPDVSGDACEGAFL